MDKKHWLVGLFYLFFFPFTVLAEHPWPMFAHDRHHTGRASGEGPRNGGELVVKWVRKAVSPAVSSCVLAEESRLYLTSGGYLLAINAANGQELWRYPIGSQSSSEDILSTPAIGEDGTIYVGSRAGRFCAVNPNGQGKWVYEKIGPVVSSPVIGSDGSVYVTAHEGSGEKAGLYAFTPDGFKWKYSEENSAIIYKPCSSPAMDSETGLYFGEGGLQADLYAVSTQGTKIFTFRTGNWINSSPCVGKYVVFGSSDRKLYAIFRTGEIRKKWEILLDGPAWYYSPSLATAGKIWFACQEKLYIIDEESGEKVLVCDLKEADTPPADRFAIAPSLDKSGYVYIGCSNGHIHAFKPDGSPAWKFPVEGSLGEIVAPIAIGKDSTLYVVTKSGGEGKVYAICEKGTAGDILGKIKVESPQSRATWEQGKTYSLNWTYTGFVGPEVKIELVDGETVVTTIAESVSVGTEGVGSTYWTIPAAVPGGDNYRVKIVSLMIPAISALSESFTISGKNITVTVPAGGETWYVGTQENVRWTYTGNPGSTVRVDLLKGSRVVGTITPNRWLGSSGEGFQTWSLPLSLKPGNDYRIRVRSNIYPKVEDTSEAFTISAGQITVVSPAGGETWYKKSTYTISWNYLGFPGPAVVVELLRAGYTVGALATVSTGSNGQGSLSWKVPENLPSGTDYQIRVRSVSFPEITDTSEAFTIAEPIGYR